MGNTSSARRGKPWGETILCCVSPTEIHYEVVNITVCLCRVRFFGGLTTWVFVVQAPATQKSSTEIDNETITLSASNTTDTCTLNGAVGACGTASCIAAPVPYPPEASKVDSATAFSVNFMHVACVCVCVCV